MIPRQIWLVSVPLFLHTRWQSYVLNLQAPGSPFGTAKPGNGRLVLVRVGVAEGFKEGMLLGTRNDPLSTLGRVQGQKAAELLMDIQVGLC